jgi:hypothetical protein
MDSGGRKVAMSIGVGVAIVAASVVSFKLKYPT